MMKCEPCVLIFCSYEGEDDRVLLSHEVDPIAKVNVFFYHPRPMNFCVRWAIWSRPGGTPSGESGVPELGKLTSSP